jgi:4-amino-4-deoxy-L-arabinose transferase-like glycosyltransferase
MRFYKISGIILLILLWSYPIFKDLDRLPIQRWDESRNAVSALEMMGGGNIFVRSYEGKPDHWETKPPLLCWLQAGSMWLVGKNELGVRLPSAIAVLGMMALLFWFFCQEPEHWITGAAAGLTLLTAKGFMGLHIARTGDHDAVLCFFLLLSFLNYYRWLESMSQEAPKNKYLWLTILGIAGAFLTKSIIGFIYLPAFLVYTIHQKKLPTVLKNKTFWLGCTTLFAIVIGYYAVCEHYDPGHFGYVWSMEMLPRYLNNSKLGGFNTLEANRFYFIKEIINGRFFFAPLLVIGFLFVLLKKKTSENNILLFSSLVAAQVLITISLGCVNDWYDAPIYAILAIIVGLVMTGIIIILMIMIEDDLVRVIALGVLLCLIFIVPYRQTLSRNANQIGALDEPRFDKLKTLIPTEKPILVLFEGYAAPAIFYTRTLNTSKQANFVLCEYNLKEKKAAKDLKLGDQLFICQKEILEALTQKGIKLKPIKAEVDNALFIIE